ncbi:MAG: hypothetical protein WD042_07985 [Phycisphaeraceae bacterium]
MNAVALAEQLNRLIALEQRGLAEHLREARPYLTPRTFALWRKIEQMGDVSAHHVARLSAMLADLGQPQRAGGFEPRVADFHFIDLPRLLPELVAIKEAKAKAYHRAAQLASERADLATELEAMAQVTHEQLATLQGAPLTRA